MKHIGYGIIYWTELQGWHREVVSSLCAGARYSSFLCFDAISSLLSASLSCPSTFVYFLSLHMTMKVTTPSSTIWFHSAGTLTLFFHPSIPIPRFVQSCVRFCYSTIVFRRRFLPSRSAVSPPSVWASAQRPVARLSSRKIVSGVVWLSRCSRSRQSSQAHPCWRPSGPSTCFSTTRQIEAESGGVRCKGR